MDSAPVPSQQWPGQRLGLPETGPRSVGRLGRRVIAIAVDWLLATVISVAFFSPGGWSDSNAFATLAVFAAAQIVFLVILNGSVGHLVLGLRLVPIERGYLGVWRPMVRTVLLCTVIPAVIFNTDQRGLHDIGAGTVLVRR